MIPSAAIATSGLIKNQLSDQFRAEILNGSLKPGETHPVILIFRLQNGDGPYI